MSKPELWVTVEGVTYLQRKGEPVEGAVFIPDEGTWVRRVPDGAVERMLDNWWTQESVRLGLSTVNAEYEADWKARHRVSMSGLLRAAVGGSDAS